MHIKIHDVEHGACTVLTAPNGKRLMIDCGRSPAWWPSITYFGQRIDTLILQNLDEDHVEDLPNVWRWCPIDAIVSNPTVDIAALASIKRVGGMGPGVRHTWEIMRGYGHGMIGDWSDDLGGIRWHCFWNTYGWDFADTNNLSLATFVSYGGFTMLFGGDMECDGWKALLRIPAFRARLAEVKVYVASHHGRDNGRCEDLFDYMRPELVVFSDKAKEHGTQEGMTDWYAARVSGIPDFGRPTGLASWARRKVMTTRSDGTISLGVRADGSYLVSPEMPEATPLHGARALAGYLR